MSRISKIFRRLVLAVVGTPICVTFAERVEIRPNGWWSASGIQGTIEQRVTRVPHVGELVFARRRNWNALTGRVLSVDHDLEEGVVKIYAQLLPY